MAFNTGTEIMTTGKPTTAAAASKLLSELEAKRIALTAVINSTADRRKGHVVAAEFGDQAAKETLQQIAAEHSQAQDALQNLQIVVAEMKVLRDELAAEEAAAREQEAAAVADEEIDAILKKSDEIDATFEHARKLITEYDELGRSAVLRQVRNSKSAGALVVRDREVSETILAYFDGGCRIWAAAGNASTQSPGCLIGPLVHMASSPRLSWRGVPALCRPLNAPGRRTSIASAGPATRARDMIPASRLQSLASRPRTSPADGRHSNVQPVLPRSCAAATGVACGRGSEGVSRA